MTPHMLGAVGSVCTTESKQNPLYKTDRICQTHSNSTTSSVVAMTVKLTHVELDLSALTF